MSVSQKSQFIPEGSEGLHPMTFEPTPKWCWKFHSMGPKNNTSPIVNANARARRSRGDKRRLRKLRAA